MDILIKIGKWAAAILVILVLIYFFSSCSRSKSSSPTANTAVEENAAIAAAAVASTPVVKTEEQVIRDGIRESLKLEYGTVHKTVEMKAPPAIRWEVAGNDPNLRFPIDSYGDIVLGLSPNDPPAIVDPEPGYRWVKVEAKNAPAKWKGAAQDTGRVFGIVPAVLAKQGK